MLYVGIPTEVKIFKDYFGKILDQKIESLVMEITIFIYCVLTSKLCFYYISISPSTCLSENYWQTQVDNDLSKLHMNFTLTCYF